MRKRLDRRFIPSSSTKDAQVANSPVDEKMELEQANVLYSLLENRYTRKVHSQRESKMDGNMDANSFGIIVPDYWFFDETCE